MDTLEKRFFDKVIKSKGCWGWKGAKDVDGYGRIRDKKKIKGAHRISWLIHNGKIPKGKQVLHKCDNPECSNPRHLYLGTGLDNMRDKINKNRARYKSKLSIKQVKKIRNERAFMTNQDLAEKYKVSVCTIYNIIKKNSWVTI